MDEMKLGPSFENKKRLFWVSCRVNCANSWPILSESTGSNKYAYQFWRHKITTEVHLYVKIWKKNENSNEVYNFTYKTLVSWYVFS